MSRLSTVDCGNLTPEQKALYDSIANGPRAAKRKSLVDEKGNLTGPFNGFLHNPMLGAHWSAIGETLRFRTALSRRLFELVVLVIAAESRCGHEWAVHASLARAEGLSEDVITALGRGDCPRFDNADDEIIYDFVRKLVTEHRIGDPVYTRAAALLGEAHLVELVNACGYYIALAAMLNAFDVHPPRGLDDPWPAKA